jgi:RsiW-degrading membrane proteinase PrsW (M82 family)
MSADNALAGQDLGGEAVFIVAGLSAILLPLLFLYIIYALDLYSSGKFRIVVICFVWGLVAFGIALAVNTAIKNMILEDRLHMATAQAYALTVVVVAPVVEEIVKSLILIYFGRRPDFTYFVDGAIYGFAAGIGFSVLENLWYMTQVSGADQGPIVVISRSFSTCLMHGSASALVGIAIGRFRYGQGQTRILSAILGWAAAMTLHMGFNRVVTFWHGAALLIGAVGLGVGGIILIALFIRWGLAEERRWIEETLGLELRVTEKEKALVRELHDLDELLKPITDRFGKEKSALVEEFLLKQAQLGIKQKSSELATDPRLKQRIQEQIAALREEMEAIRRQVGVYCMTYVRSIFPPESVVLWSNLEQRVKAAEQDTPEFNLWGKLQTTAAARTRSEPGGET